MKFLLDTDTCSFLIRGDAALSTRLAAQPLDAVRMSVVTLGELAYGCALKPQSQRLRERVTAFVQAIEPVPLDASAAEHYADIRATLRAAGTPIGPNDIWIAAHARSLGMTLVSHNLREFKRVLRLKVEDWTHA
jgi:tRNA(fMet)-specific endonuclease VapC